MPFFPFTFFCYFPINGIIPFMLLDNPTFFTQHLWPSFHTGPHSAQGSVLGAGGPSLNPGPFASLCLQWCWLSRDDLIRSAVGARAENYLVRRETRVMEAKRMRAQHVFGGISCFHYTRFSLLIPRIPDFPPAPHPVMLTCPFRTHMDILTLQTVWTKQGSS